MIYETYFYNYKIKPRLFGSFVPNDTVKEYAKILENKEINPFPFEKIPNKTVLRITENEVMDLLKHGMEEDAMVFFAVRSVISHNNIIGEMLVLPRFRTIFITSKLSNNGEMQYYLYSPYDEFCDCEFEKTNMDNDKAFYMCSKCGYYFSL